MKDLLVKVNDHFLGYIDDWEFSTYLLIGSYGSSKSYETATKILLKLLSEKRKCLVVRETFEQLKESCYDLFYEILESWDMVREEKVKEMRHSYVIAYKSPLEFKFPNGSRIIFKGMDKPTKVKSINGVSILWMEEASEIKYSAYKELILRLRNPDYKVHYILTTNPVDKSNWIYKQFFERKEVDNQGKEKLVLIQSDDELYKKRIIKKKDNDTYYHHSVPEDNSFLSISYIEKLDELKRYDPDLYRVARLGRFGVSGSRVLPQFKVAKDPDKFKESVNRCTIKRQGMDFGFETSFNALIYMAVDLENSILYLYDEFYKNKMTDKQTAEALTLWRSDVKDVLVKCDSAEPKTIKYYRDEGFRFQKTNKTTRIEQIKKIKRFKAIICSPKCKNTIRELSDLVYRKDKTVENILDEFNIDPHTLSAIWYGLDDISVANLKERKNNSYASNHTMLA